MLAAILVSRIASAWVLRRLELEVRLPEHVIAGRSAPGCVLLRNPRRWLPSFSICVLATRQGRRTPEKQWRWEPTTFSFPINRPPEQQWLRLPECQPGAKVIPPPPGIFEAKIYFPFLPPGVELSADVELHFDRRGYREEQSNTYE